MSPQELTPYYASSSLSYNEPITSVEDQISGIIGSSSTIFIFLAVLVVFIVAYWKIFKKAGEEGWKSIIPIYSNIVLYRIAGISPWWILGSLATIIPGIGWLITLAINIYFNYNLAKSFGKGIGFTIGLLLLSPIFILILAFGSSEHQGTTDIG